MINFAAMGFAINPNSEFMHFSSSEALVTRNVTNMRKIIENPVYQATFPNTKLSNDAKGSIVTTAGGIMYAAPFLGQITGFGCGKLGSGDNFAGAMLIDDPIKTQDAFSETVREKVNFTWANTLISRKNDERTPVIITAQRVHERDFCGFLIQEEGTVEQGGKWDVVVFPAILDEGTENERALWSFRLSLEKLKEQRQLDKWVFDTQYMQNPKPIEGLMYGQGFKEYEIKPPTSQTRRCIYVDTADTGADYLCAIVYDETEIGNYVVDVLYTQKPMEYTEPEVANMITKHQVQYAHIESNNGGRNFCRSVEKLCRMMNNNKTQFNWFHQTENKQVRIFTRSAEVQNLTYMPKGWSNLFPAFYKSITTFMKTGNNIHDDAEDAITGTIEKRGFIKQAQDLSKFF